MISAFCFSAMLLLVLLLCRFEAATVSKSLNVIGKVEVKSNFAGSAHHTHGIEKLDRSNYLDHVIAILEDPRVDLFVGLLAGYFALTEVLKDFKNIGAHHGLVVTSLLHALKASTSVIKEGRRGTIIFDRYYIILICQAMHNLFYLTLFFNSFEGI